MILSSFRRENVCSQIYIETTKLSIPLAWYLIWWNLDVPLVKVTGGTAGGEKKSDRSLMSISVGAKPWKHWLNSVVWRWFGSVQHCLMIPLSKSQSFPSSGCICTHTCDTNLFPDKLLFNLVTCPVRLTKKATQYYFILVFLLKNGPIQTSLNKTTPNLSRG